ncbi:MAG: beta-ketoacyl-ACP synthase II [Clostridiales bacterium]|nr:beta-ketoacyl-ACP synthase II [Clostridiales bacterium]
MMNRVVITGLGAITPLGCDVAALWEGLVSGKCGIGPITKFDTCDHKAKLAAEVKDFDARQYMDKSEVSRSDLYTQYAVAAACQAVKDSGIAGAVAPERFGVYMGTGIGGISTFIIEHTKLIEKGPRRISPLFIPMMIANIASGVIAIRYNCRGPAMPAVTACASGANAIGEAARLIRHGYADVMIAGGAEAAINPLAMAGFANMQALSTADDPSAACLPFDSRRSGFVMGEGAAALVLENYSHAVARGAKIYAELVGYGCTCDAYHITAPEPTSECGAHAIVDSLREAGYTPDDRIYINAHGTGTPYNDKAETQAIKIALGEEVARRTPVSSTKSMTGHMLGAAGAVEAAAAVLALCEGTVPPTIGLSCPDPECDLDYVPLESRKYDFNLALSVSLGFGGHNVCLAFRKLET